GGPGGPGGAARVVGWAGDGAPVVLRWGGTPTEAIEAVVGRPVRVAAAGEKVASPGMLDRHYAPRTPMRLVDRLSSVDPAEFGGRAVGRVSLRGDREQDPAFGVVEALSPTGDLVEAAANLFGALHRLDAAGLDVIVAEAVPEVGLGRAINDRLRRASWAEAGG
ncbi:MAG: Sua5 family C-terminal domain-containing protein, partial [Planctomycetota bacterium]